MKLSNNIDLINYLFCLIYKVLYYYIVHWSLQSISLKSFKIKNESFQNRIRLQRDQGTLHTYPPYGSAPIYSVWWVIF